MMTERDLTLLILGAAIVAVAVALNRQGALRGSALAIVAAAVIAVLSFLIFTYS